MVEERSPDASDGGPSSGHSWLNSLRVAVSGDVDTTFSLQAQGTSIGGGCTGSSPISMSFHQGNWALPNQPWTNTAFTTTEIVGTGLTGTFDVEEITWDHGILERSVGGQAFRLPNRFTGVGTIDIVEHRATSDDRRFRATLRGTRLVNDEGLSVDLVAEIDLDFSCGVSMLP